MKFVSRPKHYAYISAGIGIVVAFFMVFLEPYDTPKGMDVAAQFKLAGYGFIIFISMMASYWFERKWYLKSDNKWHIANEAFAMIMLFMMVAILTNIYHALMFGDKDKTLIEFALFIVKFVTPFIVIFFPIIILLRQHFGTSEQVAFESEDIEEHQITVKGENSGESLSLPFSRFYFAESQQNYVTLHTLDDADQMTQTMLRATLSDIEQQLPNALRVHRSYLINPQNALSVDGSKRKAKVFLKHIQDGIPIGTTYYDKLVQYMQTRP